MPLKTPKSPRSYRLSEEALRLMALMSERHGVGLTGVLELAVRALAERDGLREAKVRAEKVETHA
jgi:hypothetical protein